MPSARWAAPLKETSLRMPCILVIDDDPELRGVVREMLEGAGYAVLEASDGHAGVQVCQTSALDLVITDLLMPEHDGYATIRALRTVGPRATIIVISGAGSIGQRDMLAFAACGPPGRRAGPPQRVLNAGRADGLAAIPLDPLRGSLDDDGHNPSTA